MNFFDESFFERKALSIENYLEKDFMVGMVYKFLENNIITPIEYKFLGEEIWEKYYSGISEKELERYLSLIKEEYLGFEEKQSAKEILKNLWLSNFENKKLELIDKNNEFKRFFTENKNNIRSKYKDDRLFEICRNIGCKLNQMYDPGYKYYELKFFYRKNIILQLLKLEKAREVITYNEVLDWAYISFNPLNYSQKKEIEDIYRWFFTKKTKNMYFSGLRKKILKENPEFSNKEIFKEIWKNEADFKLKKNLAYNEFIEQYKDHYANLELNRKFLFILYEMKQAPEKEELEFLNKVYGEGNIGII